MDSSQPKAREKWGDSLVHLSTWLTSNFVRVDVDIDAVNLRTSIDNIKPKTSGRNKTRTIQSDRQIQYAAETLGRDCHMTPLNKAIYDGLSLPTRGSSACYIVWLPQALQTVSAALWSCLACWIVMVSYQPVVLGLTWSTLVLRFTASTCNNIHLDEMWHQVPRYTRLFISCLGVESGNMASVVSA